MRINNSNKIKSILLIWIILIGFLPIILFSINNIEAAVPTLSITKVESSNETVIIYYTTTDGDGDKLNTTVWEFSKDGTNWYKIDESAITNNTPKLPGPSSITWNTTIGTYNLSGVDDDSIWFRMKVTDETQYLEKIQSYDFSSPINSPNALTFDSSGTLYVYNTNNYKIYSLTVGSSSLTQKSSWLIKHTYQSNPYNCEGVMGIAWSGSNFYAVSKDVSSTPFDDEEIYRFNSNWVYINEVDHGEDVPTGLTHDGTYTYLCGEANNQIEKYTNSGSAGSTSSLISDIQGLAYDGTNIWSMDWDYSFHRYSSDLKSKTSFSKPSGFSDLDEITYYNGYLWGCTKSDKLYKFELKNSTSDYVTSSSFSIDNNDIPIISSINTIGDSGNITITYNLMDPENDNCILKIQYRGGSVGTNWTNASIKESTNGVTPGINKTLTWQSKNNESNYESNDYKIKIIPRDNDIGISAISPTFYIDNNDIPFISNIQVSGNSENVTITCNLIDNETDLCDLLVEYQGGSVGTKWTNATINETLINVTPQSGLNLTWESNKDENGKDANDYRIRVTPKDKDIGIPVISSKFDVDNNDVPLISGLTISGNKGDIILTYTLEDNETDLCNILVEYQGGSVGTQWSTATIKESVTNITPGSDLTITWESKKDEDGQEANNYRIRITPKDNDFGSSDISQMFSLNNNNPPFITNISILGNAGDIIITLDLKDNESHFCNLEVEYQGGLKGTKWTNAIIKEFPLTNLKPKSNLTLTWQSDEDEEGQDADNYKIRIKPEDSDIGSWVESDLFHVDNNDVPFISNIKTIGNTGNITITFDLTDNETDPCNLIIQYQGGSVGTKWINATINKSLINVASESRHTFIWESDYDLGGIDDLSVFIKITPSDNDTGSSVISSLFHVDNNKLPIISNLIIIGNSNNINLTFDLFDPENDKCNISIDYRGGSTGNTWTKATIIEPLNIIQPKNGIKFTWQSKHDEDEIDSNDYEIQIIPKDNDPGKPVESNQFQIDNKMPIITSGPHITDTTNRSVTIEWTTDEPCNCILQYGTSKEYDFELENNNYKDNQTIFIDDLIASTTYYYRIKLMDKLGNGPSITEDQFEKKDNKTDIENVSDIDNDKIPDYLDNDDDGDNYNDVWEEYLGTDRNDILDTPLDTDNDNLPDGDSDNSQSWMDTDDDNDGVSDLDEIKAGSDPQDNSKLPDVTEDKVEDEKEKNNISFYFIIFIIVIILVIILFVIISKKRKKMKDELSVEAKPIMDDVMFSCPKCNTKTLKSKEICSECKTIFAIEEFKVKNIEQEMYECPECGTVLTSNETVCPECHTEFEEEFECPECGANIESNINICPTCGTEFED